MKELLDIASQEAEKAYCPYSNFKVCAVLETADGRKFVGVNVENASYGLTICAERVAVFKAVSEGFKKFKRILVYSPNAMPYPCGACRQVLAEFCPDGELEVIVSDGKKTESFLLKELLPFSFNL